MVLDAAASFRVFLSHTSELREFPSTVSYVAALERAVSAAGHVIVDMTDFPAVDSAPADVCIERVQSCGLYVGVLGTRYGSPVRNREDVSYTELEFETATRMGIPRLMFLLDTDAIDVGIPLARLIDNQYGARQEAFRQRVTEDHLVVRRFANPDQLQNLVERSLRELREKHELLAVPPFPGMPLRVGSTGRAVRTWQLRMAERGWLLAVDGRFGRQSEQACREFQREKNLPVDGIVGPITWDASWRAPVT